MFLVNSSNKSAKSLYPICLLLIIGFNFLLRIIYIFYGYISTEEGTLLLNQKSAYLGRIPFLHYDAWNSLLNDYLIGWYQLILTPSILSQRFIGLILALSVLMLTLKIAHDLGGRLLVLFTAIFMTFGSFTYLYLSNIPYSPQTMTLLMMISLLLLNQKITGKNLDTLMSSLSLLFMTIAVVNFIQALPALLLLLLYLLLIYRFNLRKLIQISILSLIFIVIVITPFLKNIDNLIYSVTWPFYADKILIYQINSKISFSTVLTFFQEILRDYFVFICFVIVGVFTGLIPLIYKVKSRLNNNYFLLLLFLISLSFIISGLIHKPPYASYINPATPLLALLTAWSVLKFTQLLKTKITRIYFFIIISFILLSNFLNYPHYKLMKTSWNTRDKTPHYYLNQIGDIIRKTSTTDDKILSFYTPVVSASNRQAVDNFNRDRFSMTLLDDEQAKKYHLTNNNMLMDMITFKKAKIIAYSEKSVKYFGVTQEEQRRIREEIDNNYILIEKYSNFDKIEGPKTQILYLYLRKY